jgi:hypothetical protein
MIKSDEDDEFDRIAHEIEMKKGQPYVYAPKREWVGLTDEEIRACIQSNKYAFEIVRGAEAKLKEKNT